MLMLLHKIWKPEDEPNQKLVQKFLLLMKKNKTKQLLQRLAAGKYEMKDLLDDISGDE